MGCKGAWNSGSLCAQLGASASHRLIFFQDCIVFRSCFQMCGRVPEHRAVRRTSDLCCPGLGTGAWGMQAALQTPAGSRGPAGSSIFKSAGGWSLPRVGFLSCFVVVREPAMKRIYNKTPASPSICWFHPEKVRSSCVFSCL